jgi:hypothetical protein
MSGRRYESAPRYMCGALVVDKVLYFMTMLAFVSWGGLVRY